MVSKSERQAAVLNEAANVYVYVDGDVGDGTVLRQIVDSDRMGEHMRPIGVRCVSQTILTSQLPDTSRHGPMRAIKF